MTELEGIAFVFIALLVIIICILVSGTYIAFAFLHEFIKFNRLYKLRNEKAAKIDGKDHFRAFNCILINDTSLIDLDEILKIEFVESDDATNIKDRYGFRFHYKNGNKEILKIKDLKLRNKENNKIINSINETEKGERYTIEDISSLFYGLVNAKVIREMSKDFNALVSIDEYDKINKSIFDIEIIHFENRQG